jgi:hypothetical protein
MLSKNTWSKESSKYYITTITVGDTQLEVYGEVVDPEHDIGYTGDVELYDLRIASPDGTVSTSIWEMAICYPGFIEDVEAQLAGTIL